MTAALPPQSYIAWKASITTLHALAQLCTILCLLDRLKRRQTWWDDYLIILVSLVDCVYVAVMWLGVKPLEGAHIEDLSGPLYSFWLTSFSYFTVTWLSRISLTLSTARILPPKQLPSYISYFLACLFSAMYIGGVVATKQLWNVKLIDTDDPDPSRLYKSSIVNIGTDIILSLDLAADTNLFLFPLLLFWNVKLEPAQRRLILPLFSASILTLLSVVVFAIFSHGIFDLGPDTLLIITMLTYIEAGISFLVCNLLVVVFCFYRYIRRRNEDEDEDTSSAGRDESAQARSKTGDLDLDSVLTRPSQINTHSWSDVSTSHHSHRDLGS